MHEREGANLSKAGSAMETCRTYIPYIHSSGDGGDEQGVG